MEEIGIKPAQLTKVRLLPTAYAGTVHSNPEFGKVQSDVCQAGGIAAAEEPEDLYVNYKQLQRHLEFLQVQEDYIKVLP